MQLFVSYASEDFDLAEQVALALGPAHQVFFDRDALPPGGDYNSRIRAAIGASDGLIFMISPDSVQPGGYSLTELEFARDRWQHPLGHVLPVMARPTDFADIPNYLKAVTILEAAGNLPAEVAAAADGIWNPHPVIAGLSGFANLVHHSESNLQHVTKERRETIADYLDDIHDRLLEAHQKLSTGEIPHGTCAEILAAGGRLVNTIGDAVSNDDIQALGEQLNTAYRVEYLLVDVADDKERKATLAELDRAAGTFRAIAKSIRASL